ncbi:4'-phosphopantetheinyl transferase superfamily protein [Winogradskyella sp.]|uniref:4'-phosphopantetheinyl transferase family protein n=1 Tax=Winogradskyella sp. TaxID=1883156 RepID=UPI001B2DF478|nr:4'-phosphopantetheinyl transferase superfamily protein [Winogradskyella sp.]MBO6879335.1 4-phosphopantetheinyl transferase family protein [Winogradskyella sp.]
MVGNDIVDLAEAKMSSNWQRPRFLEKLFTPNEQQYIKNSNNPFLKVWQLWSMKEAAYKLYTQLNPSRFYSPKSFDCAVQNKNQKVFFKDFECYIQSKVTSNYIISEARLNLFEMNSEVIRLNVRHHKSQSKETKSALLSSISRTHQVPFSELKLQKSEFGIPTVSFNSEKIKVSISHHGQFGAYAFMHVALPAKAGVSL